MKHATPVDKYLHTSKLEREADYDEAVWCKIVLGNSKLTIGLVYRSPNINEEDNTKIKTL